MDKLPQLPELENLNLFETQLVHEYLNNGHNGLKAYQALKPEVTYDTARSNSSTILTKPHVKAYLEAYKGQITVKAGLTKDKLLDYTTYGLELAKSKEELSSLFKGVEVGAKLIGAYEQDADDLTKYTGLLTKIKANNVQININNVQDKNG